MQYQTIQNILLQLNLNVDPATTLKIHHLINNQIGFDLNQTFQIQKYNIYAALAIVSEQDKIPTMDGKMMTSNGIQIQQIINHIGELSIETYINYIENLIKKYRNANESLIFKISDLKMAYRIFLKYKNICRDIYDMVGTENSDLILDFQNFTWILYLYSKHQNGSHQLPEQTQSLIFIVQLAAMLFKLPIKSNQLQFIISKQFNFKIQFENEHPIKQSLIRIINKVKSLRHRDIQQIELILNNDNSRVRFVDDLMHQYQKMKQNLKFNYIDEIKFLKLNKIIPPQKITNTDQTQTFKFSSKKINFQTFQMQSPPQTKQSQMKIQPAINFSHFKKPVLFSPILKRKGFVQISPIPKKCDQTPISSKMNQSQWINKKINSFNEKSLSQLERIFLDAGQNYYESVQKLCLGCINKIVDAYNYNNQSRIKKIYKLFQSFLLSITKSIQRDERSDLIKNQQYLMSLLCLVSNIYFYANSLQCQQIKQFSLKFGIEYMQTFKLINKVGKFDPLMPNNIRLHLLQMQRLILLLYIWQEGKGYEIISSKNVNKSYYEKVIEDRLQKHIYSRIIQIHNIMDIPEYYQQKTKSIVSYVLNEKPELLKKNYIDQIIICSLYSVLKMNINNNSYTLEQLFSKYNTLQLSFNSHKFTVYGKQDQQLNLLDFYNKVFTPEIKQAFSNQHLNHKFLSTPIKKQFDMHIGLSKSPLNRRLQNSQTQEFFKVNNNIFGDTANNKYQKNLAKRLNNIISFPGKTNQTSQQQLTPKFKLQHRFSFGKLQDLTDSPLKLRRQISFGLIPMQKNQ